MKTLRILTMALAALGLAGGAAGQTGEIGGMLSMSPVLDQSYAAIWVPVPQNHAVAGVRWYNNDGSVVFPQVLVASGTLDERVGLEGALVVATDVQGASLAWSEVTFDQPYACENEGLYCLFVFPAGVEFSAPGSGGGPAIGFTDGEAGHHGWLCADLETWMKVEGGTGLAIDPVFVPAEPGMIRMAQPRTPNPATMEEPALHPARPNPFNPQTVLEYTLTGAQHVELTIYDVTGRLVRRLVSGEHATGTHSVTWTGTDDHGRRMPSGSYFVQFVAGQHRQSQRILLVK